MSKGVLLVNLGSPDSPSVPDVRRYLNEFLMDGRVIDSPWLLRRLVVGLILIKRPGGIGARLRKNLDAGRFAARRHQPQRAAKIARRV
jgi:protoheme ferro-lyase